MPEPPSETPHNDDAPIQPGPFFSSRRLSLPRWLDHFKTHDIKHLIRCWVATWVSSILMFIQPSLNSIGVATFFGPLMLYLMPPVGVLSAYLLNTLLLLCGMCLAWAWGLVTMKAALAARSPSQTQVLVQKLNEQAMLESKKSGQSVSLEMEKLVHEGFMLDARVTVVFYVMSCIFVYTMARLRAANPKFAPAETFGNIVMDLFLLYGPTLPSFTGDLGKVLVLPGAIGIGLGVVCCLLFFPQSASYSVLSQMEDVVMSCQKSLQCTRFRLAGSSVELLQPHFAKKKISSTFKAMQTMLSFLPVDMSCCRWSTEDIKGIEVPLRQLVVAHLILLDFHITRTKFEQIINSRQSEKLPLADERYQQPQGIHFALALKTPELASLRLHTRESINESMHRILDIYSESLCMIAEIFRLINDNRWLPSTSAEQPDQFPTKGEQLLDRLQSCRNETVNKTADLLIECHADVFNEDGSLKSPESLHLHSLRSLVLGMVIEERILQCVVAGEKLLSQTLRLSHDRTVKRIWLPNGPKYALSWLCNGFRETPMFISFFWTDRDPDMAKRDVQTVHRQSGLKSSYKVPSRLGIYAIIIRESYHWLTNAGGIYALRMVVVTIATAIPGSLPHTAGFFYREKGLWGVITAQICVLIYMADFLFSLLGRVAGTVIGGLLGMVTWYIGSGSGPGNPYGLAVITAVMTLVLVWCRLFFPHTLTGMAVMSGITFVLVIGFSYDATHLRQYGSPGYGYQAFYKRVVTVLLGIVAAFVVQIFPRPPSARLHVRKSLSDSVHTLSDHYALLLSCWNRCNPGEVNLNKDQMSLEVAERLSSLHGPINTLGFEPKVGPFSQETLRRTQELCQDINQALATLLTLQNTLPLSFQNRLARGVGILAEKNIADVTIVLRVIDQALKTGDAIPQHHPSLLSAIYASSNNHVEEMNTTLVRSKDYRLYCVAVTSYLTFLSAIDELVILFKNELGESHITEGLWCQASV